MINKELPASIKSASTHRKLKCRCSFRPIKASKGGNILNLAHIVGLFVLLEHQNSIFHAIFLLQSIII